MKHLFLLHAAVFTTILSLTFSPMVQAQSGNSADEITVTGTVTDEKGEPVIGAAVIQKGTVNGVSADLDGKYVITVSPNAVLVFSSIGYQDKEMALNGRSQLDVVLDIDSQTLEDVVVIGYGVQRKKLLTGATLQVKGDAIAKQNTTSALGALQSQSPGVSITQNSGQPGQGYKVNIRGIGTVGDSAPLYVIDGVAGGDINALNPGDIESIDILKDAASAAIYGARAANGVVLVTTKQGKEGRTVVSYDGYVGMQYISKMPDLCNAQEYIQLQDISRQNSGLPIYDWERLLPADLYQAVKNGTWTGTDWVGEMYNKGAITQNHALNVAGGSADHTFSIGLSYTGQDGTLGYNELESVYAKYKRATFRANSDHVAIKNKSGSLNILKIGETLTFSLGQNNGLAEGNIFNNSLHDALGATPLLPVYRYDSNGKITGIYDEAAREEYGWDFGSEAKHPIGMDYFSSRGRNTNKFYNLNASLYIQLEPIKNLKFKSQFGYNLNANDYRSYTMKYALSSKSYANWDTVNQNMSILQKFIWENTISYHFDIKDRHVFDIVAGQSIERYGIGTRLEVSSANSIFQNDFERAYISNTKPQMLSQIGLKGYPGVDGSLASFFGRINYNFDERYLLSATLRADGSSNFAPGHQWGYFPSVSAGWIISNERWMNSASRWLSFLKLRASWGQNGNSNIDPFQYLSTISLTRSYEYYYANKSVPTTGATPSILANPNVTWETSEQTDIGIDARFFDSRLGVTLDGYIKTTKDWLVKAPIADVYGMEAPYINGGDIRNSGIEISIDWGKHTGDFTYTINVNGAYNKNEVLRIANSEGIIHGPGHVLSQGTDEMYRAQVGYPVGYFYGYKTAGVFQNQAQIDATAAKYDDTKPGELIFVDTNGDGKITEDDRTMIGDPHPDFTAGLNLSFGYKGFDLGITGYGAFGHQIAKSYRSFKDCPKENYTREYFNCWNGEGTSNRLPKLTNGTDRSWANISDIYIENGDYFKISNITFGYDFKKLIKTPVISRLRLYFTVQNAFTFTKYSGMDPEVGYGYGQSWVSGIDLGYYPNPRTYMMGLNIQF